MINLYIVIYYDVRADKALDVSSSTEKLIGVLDG